jgi:L-ribulose-5-phosphate 3-epimerase
MESIFIISSSWEEFLMIKGINQWSLPIGSINDLPLVVEQCVASGITCLELCIEPVRENYFGIENDPELSMLLSIIAQSVNAHSYMLRLDDSFEEIKKLQKLILEAGANIVSVTSLDLFRYTLTSNDDRVREAAVWIIRKMIDICSHLGGSIVLIEPGVVTSTLSYLDAYNNCFKEMRKLARYAEEKNVTLALENVWGKFLLSPMEFCSLIDDIKSEAVGAYFDVANVLEFGYPQDWIKLLGNRIKSIHFKDYNINVGGLKGFCNPFDGSVNWFKVKRALEEIQYIGYVIAEVTIPDIWQRCFISELAKKLDYFINEL